MIRLNFMAPSDLNSRLNRAREETGVPVSAMIRKAINNYLTELGF